MKSNSLFSLTIQKRGKGYPREIRGEMKKPCLLQYTDPGQAYQSPEQQILPVGNGS